MKKFLFIINALLLLAALVPFCLFAFLSYRYSSRTYKNVDEAPTVHTALVLGAGLNRAATVASPILTDRINAAVALYRKGKIKKILMSGDNRFLDYNEPEVMKKLAMNLGVPAQDIATDLAGRRTYDSCWRAKNIFSQNEIIVVTQSFHMTRTLFLCQSMGMKSWGLIADEPRYTPFQWLYWQMRDVVSFYLSLIDVYVHHPSVTKGEKISL